MDLSRHPLPYSIQQPSFVFSSFRQFPSFLQPPGSVLFLSLSVCSSSSSVRFGWQRLRSGRNGEKENLVSLLFFFFFLLFVSSCTRPRTALPQTASAQRTVVDTRVQNTSSSDIDLHSTTRVGSACARGGSCTRPREESSCAGEDKRRAVDLLARNASPAVQKKREPQTGTTYRRKHVRNRKTERWRGTDG